MSFLPEMSALFPTDSNLITMVYAENGIVCEHDEKLFVFKNQAEADEFVAAIKAGKTS